MTFEKLTLSEKMAFINLAATLLHMKVITVEQKEYDEEEIVDVLYEPAKILFNKASSLKN